LGKLISFATGSVISDTDNKWSGLRAVYGSITLEPWSDQIDTSDLLYRLSDESFDGEQIKVGTFVQVCDDLRIGSDTMGEIFLALKKNGIFLFIEDGKDSTSYPNKRRK
jgi:hypothetical protein